MTLDDFLNKYNCIMNNNEIANIGDDRIREIKSKYWNLRHEAFIDEYNISNLELENIWDELSLKEKQELIECYNSFISKQ